MADTTLWRVYSLSWPTCLQSAGGPQDAFGHFWVPGRGKEGVWLQGRHLGAGITSPAADLSMQYVCF
jgi:hypothetical protein